MSLLILPLSHASLWPHPTHPQHYWSTFSLTIIWRFLGKYLIVGQPATQFSETIAPFYQLPTTNKREFRLFYVISYLTFLTKIQIFRGISLWFYLWCHRTCISASICAEWSILLSYTFSDIISHYFYDPAFCICSSNRLHLTVSRRQEKSHVLGDLFGNSEHTSSKLQKIW